MARAKKTRFGAAMRRLRALPSKTGNANIARFGLTGKDMLGVTITDLRKLSKEIGSDHELALQLWSTGVHEARLLAGMVEQVEKASDSQAEGWLSELDSWDLVDETCLNLYSKMPNPFRRARAWAQKEKEFEKRAGFALVACLAWAPNASAGDQEFIDFLPQIKKASTDERNFVKKAVNWALRQIGKRNQKLHAKALACAKEIATIDSPAAKWIASNATRELENTSIVSRVAEKDRRKTTGEKIWVR